MIFKNTWLWIAVALALLAASIWHYQRSRHSGGGPGKILAHLNTATVTNVQVRLETQLQIRAERSTNGSWVLSEPVRYPAENERIEGLLAALEQMNRGIYITRSELMNRPNAEEEYGFGAPQATIILKQGDYRGQVFIGSRTAPGDQVFLQVVGDEGIYVVDASLLNFIPRNADDWRTTELLNLKGVAFDRITITNSGKGFELRKEGTNQWRILTSDFSPRAEASKVDQLLTNVQTLRVQRFLPEEPRTDLDSFGLQNPDFQLGVAWGTNSLCALQFGKSPTNDSAGVFARNPSRNTIVIVNRTNLTPWPAMPDFRDTHLLGGLEPAGSIDIHGRDDFSLMRQTNGTWKVMPQNFVADRGLVKDLLRLLAEMQIVEFVKDVVPAQPQMLADYGLDHPELEYVLVSDSSDGRTSGTNGAVHLQWSTNRADKVLVRRSDEPSVYAVKSDEVNRLPHTSWQLRDRRIWNYSIDDLAAITIQQRGTNFGLLRKGNHQWSVAPGSKGEIQPLAIEETCLDLVDLSAAAWIARGTQDFARLGFTQDDQHITLEFKNAEKRTIELSQNSPFNFGIAAVTLDGETWIFAISPSLRRDMIAYLSIPAAAL